MNMKRFMNMNKDECEEIYIENEKKRV